MKPGQKKRLPIALVLALFWAALPGFAQDLPRGSNMIKFHVRDAAGVGIPSAVLTVDYRWVVTTDFDGIAEVDCGSNLVIGIPVEAAARGFKKKTQIVQVGTQSCIINLEKETDQSALSGSTVSVSELSTDVQERSQKLQQEGLDALKRGESDRALQVLHEALELTPSTGDIYNNLGVVHVRRRNYQQAAEWFEKAAAYSPSNPTILGNLGVIRYLQHRDQESYRLLERAVEGGYSRPTVHYMLGVLSLRKQHFAKAVDQLRKVDPSRYRYRDLYLSIGQRELGKVKAADRAFHSFVKNHKAPLAAAVTTAFLADKK